MLLQAGPGEVSGYCVVCVNSFAHYMSNLSFAGSFLVAYTSNKCYNSLLLTRSVPIYREVSPFHDDTASDYLMLNSKCFVVVFSSNNTDR